jgi:glyoxylase-like metal-dependent hydrolase (beta-lactamase superfamily II)
MVNWLLGGINPMSQPCLQQLGRHIYWLPPDNRTDRPLLGVIAGERATLLVDAGNSPDHARLLLAEVARLQLAPPQFLILTHWHWDHVFGAAAINLPTLAHPETKRRVEEMAGLDWSDAALDERVANGQEIAFCRDMIKVELPDRSRLTLRPPEISFTGRVELDLGGVTAQLIHVGGDHAADSVVVVVPTERVVFGSDCLGPDLYQQPPRYTTRRLFPLIDQLLDCPADLYLWGHDPTPEPRPALEAYTARLKTIGRVVEAVGDNREAIIKALGQPLNDDDLENIDYFLAGLNPL